MPRLIDNGALGTVADGLKEVLTPGAHLSLMSPEFSVYAFRHLQEQLTAIGAARLLLGRENAAGTAGSGAEIWHTSGLAGGPGDRLARNALTFPSLAAALAGWLRQDGEVRGTTRPFPYSLYHTAHRDTQRAIHGSSPFTTEGLGVAPRHGPSMNTLLGPDDDAQSLLAWFNSIWEDTAQSTDVREQMLSELEWIAQPQSPESVYALTLNQLFEDRGEDLDEDRIIKTRTGIRETLIWQKLYRFQRDGVLGAIDKIEKYNGCIIADSVGLGKTFEALAIIKYYELRNDRVLVLCPKRLRENWTLHTVNDRRNLFADDRFNFDVLNHTDLTRSRGQSGEINLETVNWGNYDLVVIDESHNFRNNPPRKDGLTRYGRLMREIIRTGVKTKVLMLSATPVNSRMNDLKNQIAFITEGEDDALWHFGVSSLERTLRTAQAKFNLWLQLPETERTTERLLDTLNFDYFKVLDLLTIARSRRHIEKYYDIDEMGAFPERAKPINVKADIDTERLFPPLREINRDIRRLNLSAYAPLKYVLPHKLEDYGRKYDMQVAGGSVFKQIDREQSLIHLMRVNLFKRMESSIHSFSSTVEKLLANVRDLMERLDAHEEADVEEMSIEDVEVEAEEFQPYLTGSKIKVLIQDVDRVRWKQELAEDEELLVKLLRESRDIDAGRDEKLRQLLELIQRKVQAPVNRGNRKVIVFTAFVDTAEYLFEHVASWAKTTLGVESALVTGRTGGNRSTLPGLRKDQASLLTAFSPRSKERVRFEGDDTAPELDILIATDCISEGQNLQDCDYLINYDIHWNPVRIIQRFGRIDRLGSINGTIQLVNFWPNMELDEYINLEARVTGRMVLLDISATGEENLIDADTAIMRDLEYRRRQLEQLQENVVDLEDLSTGISITDLTLNDFRMDLTELRSRTEELLPYPHPGLRSVAEIDDLFTPPLRGGVVFCLRAEGENALGDDGYALFPHYLVYVADNGEVVLSHTQTKRILDILKKCALGRSTPHRGAWSAFEARTAGGTRMEHYQELLAVAINEVVGREEQRGVESLFEPGGTLLRRGAAKGLQDFEVVAYLILQEPPRDDGA